MPVTTISLDDFFTLVTQAGHFFITVFRSFDIVINGHTYNGFVCCLGIVVFFWVIDFILNNNKSDSEGDD